MNESDSGDDDEGRVWLWGISELQCLSLFTQISIFNVYIDFCFFRCLHHHLFLMFTPISFFFNVRSTTICICFPEVEVLKTIFGVFVVWDKY